MDGASEPPVIEADLRDGTQVRLRPLRREDAPLLREGMGRLSARSRRLRFHSAVTGLSDAQLKALVDLDQHDRVALVADVLEDGDHHAVGVARYAAVPGDGPPEFAIVVEDAYQGRGIGRLLLGALFDHARRSGFDRLTAEVLAENDRMLHLLREVARDIELQRQGGSFHVDVRL